MLIPNRMFRNHAGQVLRRGDDHRATSAICRRATASPSATSTTTASRTSSWWWAAPTRATRPTTVCYVNPGNSNHWVTLQLEGVKSNRIALGAEICVTVATPHGRAQDLPDGEHRGQLRQQPAAPGDRAGRRDGDQGGEDPLAGLRRDPGTEGLGMDRFYKVREGDPVAHPWHVPTFKLPTGPAASHPMMAKGITMD